MECTRWNGIFVNGTNFGDVVGTSRCRKWEDVVIVTHGVPSLSLKNRLQRLGMGKKQEKYKNIVITIRSPLQGILCTVNYILTKIYK